jgi:F-type H+-transporting ATPase subunit gamma
MPSLKEVKTRIVSVSSTVQITSAMKMVSAAKLKRAQDAITQMRPYATKLREILENLSGMLDSSESIYSQEREPTKVLLVVITSNRGLAGAFNANVMKEVRILLNTKYQAQYKAGNVQIITIGKKATDFYTKNKFTVIKSANEVFDGLSFAKAAPIAEFIMEGFVNGEYDTVELVYNQFKNAAVQLIQPEQYLPVVSTPAPVVAGGKKAKANDYIFEPSKEEIIKDLIPLSLKTQLYKALLDSQAAEHGARMTAMHKATDNAKELIKELKLTYNKARQASITNDILEIVGGAEALNG